MKNKIDTHTLHALTAPWIPVIIVSGVIVGLPAGFGYLWQNYIHVILYWLSQ